LIIKLKKHNKIRILTKTNNIYKWVVATVPRERKERRRTTNE